MSFSSERFSEFHHLVSWLVLQGASHCQPYVNLRITLVLGLENELGGQKDVLGSLGLVVHSKKKVDEGGLYAIGPSYEEFFGPGYKEFWTFYPTQAS